MNPLGRAALEGLRVVEFAGLGPGPFACMLLSDMGADVVTVQRPGTRLGDPTDITGRGRQTVLADLKDPGQRGPLLELVDRADVVIEGFRPGVMERLGLGPDEMALRNPGLIYGRITGWGQSGPLAHSAGHDINYIALAGALHAIGPANAPLPPLNLVGDYAAGSLYLVCGILAALVERQRSGLGQTIDAAITDGTFALMTLHWTQLMRKHAVEERAANMLDGGAPYYGVYETADGAHVAIGPIEPAFFALLCERIGVDEGLRDAQHDRARWPALRREFARLFRTQTQSEWCARLEGSDCCFAPVLSLSVAARHPHNVARGAFVTIDGVNHPAPAPRFSRTPSKIQGAAPSRASALDGIVRRWTRSA